MNTWSLSSLVYKPREEPTGKENNKYAFAMYGLGVLTCLRCFLGTGSIVRSDEDYKKVEIKKLPTGFNENISSIIAARIKDSTTELSDKEDLEAGMKKIDAHVEAA
jgi:hypothetical protein